MKILILLLVLQNGWEDTPTEMLPIGSSRSAASIINRHSEVLGLEPPVVEEVRQLARFGTQRRSSAHDIAQFNKTTKARLYELVGGKRYWLDRAFVQESLGQGQGVEACRWLEIELTEAELRKVFVATRTAIPEKLVAVRDGMRLSARLCGIVTGRNSEYFLNLAGEPSEHLDGMPFDDREQSVVPMKLLMKKPVQEELELDARQLVELGKWYKQHNAIVPMSRRRKRGEPRVRHVELSPSEYREFRQKLLDTAAAFLNEKQHERLSQLVIQQFLQFPSSAPALLKHIGEPVTQSQWDHHDDIMAQWHLEQRAVNYLRRSLLAWEAIQDVLGHKADPFDSVMREPHFTFDGINKIKANLDHEPGRELLAAFGKEDTVNPRRRGR